MSSRSNIATQLITILSNTGVFNSVKAVSNIDNKYPYDLSVAELPAVKIHMTDESYDYEQSMHAINKIGVDIWMYCISDDMNSISVEAPLLKAIRDALGNNVRLNGACVNLNITHIVKVEVDYPLVEFKVNIDVLYEANISNV